MGSLDVTGLKFRVWDNERKRMFYWQEINGEFIERYLIDSSGVVYKMEIVSDSIKENEYKADAFITSLPNAIAMPFIANVNYSPLYGFDICKFKDITFVVVPIEDLDEETISGSPFLAIIAKNKKDFDEKSYRFYKHLYELALKKYSPKRFWGEVEVIGNIFENRDLLTPYTLKMLKNLINIDWEMVYD